MKHLAFITEDFPPLPGGIARLCWEISHRLSSHGWQVTVIAPEAPATSKMAPDTEARVIRVSGKRPWRDIKMALQLRRLGHCDAVMCATWYPDGIVPLLARTRVPLVVWAHGGELYDWRARGWRRLLEGVRRRLRRHLLIRADLVLANSRFTRELVKELVPACQAIEVVPLGTDPDVFKPEPGAGLLRRQLGFEGVRVVLSVSRLSAYKGHETIMRAIPLMQSGSALRYVIVGDGPHRQSLETIAERLGIRAQIHFAGRVPDQELVLYYAMADVFALCTEERRDETDVEGFGIVFLEASASGLPIVATNAGGIPDAVADGETGFLVPAGDPAATAIALDRLLLDDQLAAAMGARGRRRVLQHFNWDNTARIVSHHLGSALPRYALSETG